MTRRRAEFQTIRSEGGLLPFDLLRRIIDPKAKLPGTRPEDYGLPQGERLNEVITQSWNRLRKHWAEFRAAAAHLPATETGTSLTNDKWSLPLLRELGFGLLPTSAGPAVQGRSYAINRFFGPVPIHLVGCNLNLDRRAAGVRGASAANPHGLVQEFLNRSEGHLWAMLGNGLRLRLLRDSQALSRQSFLEFDLEAMFAGEVYSDFVLLWLSTHATRLVPQGEAQGAQTCWLEQWTKLAQEQGTRALGELRSGVEKALQVLGEGFTSHPKNTTLRERLRAGQTSLADFHGQLLRVVYRLIFLAQVLPGGIYGGANASAIRQFMLDQCELRHLWGLINTRRGWFAHVDIDRFAAYAVRRGGRTSTLLAHFGLTEPADLGGHPVELDADFIRTNAPDTYAIPDVRSAADVTVAKKMLDAYPAYGIGLPSATLLTRGMSEVSPQQSCRPE